MHGQENQHAWHMCTRHNHAHVLVAVSVMQTDSYPYLGQSLLEHTHTGITGHQLMRMQHTTYVDVDVTHHTS